MKKINILGALYSIVFATTEEKPYLKSADGYMDCTLKEIVIGKFDQTEDSVGDIEEYTKKVIRHEIIHAALYESGLWSSSHTADGWAMDEEMTDWIAIQFPKLLRMFKEADAL